MNRRSTRSMPEEAHGYWLRGHLRIAGRVVFPGRPVRFRLQPEGWYDKSASKPGRLALDFQGRLYSHLYDYFHDRMLCMGNSVINSFEVRVAAFLLLLLPTSLVAWFAFVRIVETIKTERIKTVGRVADVWHEQLKMVFRRAIGRAEAILLEAYCSRQMTVNTCNREALQTFLGSEGALGGILNDPLTGTQLAVRYSEQLIQPVFDVHPDLGVSGETFLADGEGFFITRARYPATQGREHPISARPMQRCLSPENAETLDLDYRDVAIIHGFRFVSEIGGGCIMAHVDQAEAFAPLVTLKSQLLVAVGLGHRRRVLVRQKNRRTDSAIDPCGAQYCRRQFCRTRRSDGLS